MSDEAKRNLKNVMVLALVDKKLTEGEKQFIDRLRTRVGIDEKELRRLVSQVRQDPKKISLPRGGPAAKEAVRVLVETAKADGEVTHPEQKLLQRIARCVGLSRSQLDAMLSGGEEEVGEDEINARVDAIYAEFARWDAPTRCERIRELGDMGGAGVPALLYLMESYRTPDGMDNALELKTLVAEQLGRIGDERAAYYLVQQVNIGDIDDEISSSQLRYAAAEALGKIVGKDFARDQSGVEGARVWWTGPQSDPYDRLAF